MRFKFISLLFFVVHCSNGERGVRSGWGVEGGVQSGEVVGRDGERERRRGAGCGARDGSERDPQNQLLTQLLHFMFSRHPISRKAFPTSARHQAFHVFTFPDIKLTLARRAAHARDVAVHAREVTEFSHFMFSRNPISCKPLPTSTRHQGFYFL